MGQLSDGSSCAETNTGKITRLTLDETVDLLEPQQDRTCVPVGHADPKDPSKWIADFSSVCAQDQSIGLPVQMPARAGAICRSAEDEGKLKTAVETMCRMLGKRCTYEMRQAIEAL